MLNSKLRRRVTESEVATNATENAADPNRDLGFGGVVARESRLRLLNRDGTFNVEREGLSAWQSLSPYNFLLTTTWPKFLAVVVSFYIVINAFFAAIFWALGPEALAGVDTEPRALPRFLQDFFFSVQTFATIGYGAIHPRSQFANWLVAVEALIGLLGLALATGLVFARFARPGACILMSRQALIAPYGKGGADTALMFRIANARTSQLLDVHATVILGRFRADAPGSGREFFPLKLERDSVAFFPLAWTLVHPIDETSPLWGVDIEEMRETSTEVLVLLTGFDETFSQNVHTRSSYSAEEMVWGARFVDLFNPLTKDGRLSIDIGKLHEWSASELPTTSTSSPERLQ